MVGIIKMLIKAKMMGGDIRNRRQVLCSNAAMFKQTEERQAQSLEETIYINSKGLLTARNDGHFKGSSQRV